MAQRIGALLQELRTRRGLSLGGLARAAGIDKSALSRWEAGKRQPRIVELEAALDALNATPEQRSLALSRIDAPRAIRRLREIGAAGAPGPPPMAGDLLRAMRLRKGWTQEEQAQTIGVKPAAVTRWERGERLPSTGQIQALCYALNASGPEFIALTTGIFTGEASAGGAAVWHEKEDAFQRRLNTLNDNPVKGLEDLGYLMLAREVWEWAAQTAAARPLLARIYLGQAQFSRNQERWAAVLPLARRAEAAAPVCEQTTEALLRLAVVKAAGLALGGSYPAPARGLRYLTLWAERSSLPTYTAWILSDMAQYAALDGQSEYGVSLAERACQAAEAGSNGMEVFLRRCDFARRLLDANRPGSALHVLPERTEGYSHDEARLLLLRAEGLLMTGNPSEAHDWLRKAYAIIETEDLDARRREADALALRF